MLQPVKAESLSAQVAETIREAIFRAELKPGQVLRELGLAKNLKVSQATVREALSHLEHYGLVIRTPNRSTAVTNLSMNEVADRLRVRLELECLAFCDAAKNMTEEQQGNIERMGAAVADAIATGSSFDIMRADRFFHQRVWEAAGNPILYRSLDQLTTPLFAFFRNYRETQSVDGLSGKPYEELVEALRTRDQEVIVAAVRRHLEGFYQSFLTRTADAAPASAETAAEEPGRQEAASNA